MIPPHTRVMPSLLAVKLHPEYWQDPMRWQPRRWISVSASQSPSKSDSDVATQLRQETLVSPVEGTYFPWSDGPQNSTGAKFAQVEFVAVLACLIRGHQIEVIHGPNESSREMKERVLATEDFNLGLLLRMRNADRIRLLCKSV